MIQVAIDSRWDHNLGVGLIGLNRTPVDKLFSWRVL